jgi:hypothetical protein
MNFSKGVSVWRKGRDSKGSLRLSGSCFSGTGELAGIGGSFSIKIADGVHSIAITMHFTPGLENGHAGMALKGHALRTRMKLDHSAEKLL